HARNPIERVTMRVQYCYRSPHGPWLPRGSTGKHLRPNVVEDALEQGYSRKKFWLELGGRALTLVGHAVPIPFFRFPADPVPHFKDFPVPDERGGKMDVVLLAVPESDLGAHPPGQALPAGREGFNFWPDGNRQ